MGRAGRTTDRPRGPVRLLGPDDPKQPGEIDIRRHGDGNPFTFAREKDRELCIACYRELSVEIERSLG